MGAAADIRFLCPHCSGKLKVPAKLAGRRVACPNPACRKPVDIPLSLDDDAPPPAAPPAEPPAQPPEPPAESPEELLARHRARVRQARLLRRAALAGCVYGLVAAVAAQNPYYDTFRPSVGRSEPPRLDGNPDLQAKLEAARDDYYEVYWGAAKGGAVGPIFKITTNAFRSPLNDTINTPMPAREAQEELDRARAWTPSPVWLPAVLLYHAGFGGTVNLPPGTISPAYRVTHRPGEGWVYSTAPAGYHVKSVGEGIAFCEACVVLGGLLGLAVGGVVLLVRGRRAGPRDGPTRADVLRFAGRCGLALLSGFVCFTVGFLIAAAGARTNADEDARGLPVGLNAFLLGLAIPSLVRHWRAGSDGPASDGG